MRILRPANLDDAALVSSNVAEDATYADWNLATTYGALDRCRRVAANVHKVFQSKAGGNLNHDPLLDTAETYWAEVGATNRWAMFDDKVESQTQNADSIVVELQPGGIVDTVALLNISAASAHVVVTRSTGQVVRDQTFDLVSRVGINTWFKWYFEPIIRRRVLVITNLPRYANAKITITLSDPGKTVKCGVCKVGQARVLGGTQWGGRTGVRDFSRKEKNTWGDDIFVERAFAKRGSFTVLVNRTEAAAIQDLLADYRVVPLVWIADLEDATTIIFGKWNEFEQEIAYPTRSLFSLEIEGLT